MMTLLVLFAVVSLGIPQALSGLTAHVPVDAAAFPEIADRVAFEQIDETQPPTLTARGAGIWDSKSGKFVYEKNVHGSFPIASITKLMTALLIVEQGIDLGMEETIVRDDNDPEGSFVSLPVGSVVTVQDLFAATLVASGNNAAEALARASGMDEAVFVSAMNARAADLGMSETKFTDVTGLGSTNRSTVADVMILLHEALKHPEIRDATTKQSVEISYQPSGAIVSLKTTNALLDSSLPITGGKTGTGGNGASLALALQSGAGHDVYVVVLGSANRASRFDDGRLLAEWALHSFRYFP